MIFQKVLKGITGLSTGYAQAIVQKEGILCNLWRNKGVLTNSEIKDELTDANLFYHLNEYDTSLPVGHKWSAFGNTYGEVSAFISTTAGVVERDAFLKRNIIYSPFITALQFATDNFRADGYIFYAYVMVIGKKSIPLQAFAEEVRELNIYTSWLPFYKEGEVTAKISIPSVNIEKAEFYDGANALRDIRNGNIPIPGHTFTNSSYLSPENFVNIREVLQ